MGVGGSFWELLKPYARPEGFDYIRNKRVAVDLSFWIVQQETATKANVRNPHLRLTFFRTINLFSKVWLCFLYLSLCLVAPKGNGKEKKILKVMRCCKGWRNGWEWKFETVEDVNFFYYFYVLFFLSLQPKRHFCYFWDWGQCCWKCAVWRVSGVCCGWNSVALEISGKDCTVLPWFWNWFVGFAGGWGGCFGGKECRILKTRSRVCCEFSFTSFFRGILLHCSWRFWIVFKSVCPFFSL